MFSSDGTLISASAAPYCGGKKRKEKNDHHVDDYDVDRNIL